MKKESYIYPAVFGKTATGYSVHFPDLPGCVSTGGTLDAAYKMAREGLGLHLWGMEKDGDEIPEPTPVDSMLRVARRTANSARTAHCTQPRKSRQLGGDFAKIGELRALQFAATCSPWAHLER